MLNSALYQQKSTLKDFGFFQRQEVDAQHVVTIPGALTPYQSFRDLRNQLKAPLIIPIIGLIEALKIFITVLHEALLFTFHMLTLDPEGMDFHSAQLEVLRSQNGALMCTMATIADTLSSIVILATRTMATVAEGVVATASIGINATSGLFSNQEEITNDKRRYVDNVESSGLELR